MCEDVVHEGLRVALRHSDELFDKIRRYTGALAVSPDLVRLEVAAELVELLGRPCVTCGVLCVTGPICETCVARQELGSIETAGVRQ